MKRRVVLSSTCCLLSLFVGLPGSSQAQGVNPAVSSFLINTEGTTGQSTNPAINAAVSAIPADVQQVSYTGDSVYVEATGVPSYSVGPFTGNPNTPADLDEVYVLPLSPNNDDSGNPEDLGLGTMGIFVNGVAVYNPEDGFSYGNQDTWHQNASLAEATSFDDCGGHPQQQGVYHHHLNSGCLLEQLGDNGSDHSSIAGWAADGFPIYGPYGYDDPLDPASGIVRVESSYRARAITQRTVLPDGTALPEAFWGPVVASSGTNRIGWFMEDFEYVDGLGHLDDHNGRFTVTPDYPGGIYAYYVTIDESDEAAYPYFIGPTFRGEVHCGGFGETWGPGVGPPPDGCSGGSLIETADTVPAEAVIYTAPEPATLPMALGAQATLALLFAMSALRKLRSARPRS